MDNILSKLFDWILTFNGVKRFLIAFASVFTIFFTVDFAIHIVMVPFGMPFDIAVYSPATFAFVFGLLTAVILASID